MALRSFGESCLGQLQARVSTRKQKPATGRSYHFFPLPSFLGLREKFQDDNHSRAAAALTRSAFPVVVAFLLSGCSHSDFSKTKSAGNTFRAPLDVTLMSLDPALVSDNWSIDTIQNTFEGLVAMGEDNQIHPCLAESWEISKDGKNYLFHLKSGVVFQNGRPVHAEDVRKSLERACSKALAAPLAADYLDDIEGMEAFRTGKAGNILGIKVADESTVAISLSSPRPYFLAKLSLPVASVVDVSVIQDGVHIKSVPEMIGTGPFKIAKYDEGQMLLQTAFNQYHGGRPKIDAIERPVMLEATARINAFKRGEIDTVQQLTRSDYDQLRKDPQYKDMLQLVPRATLVYLAINTKDYPDQRVRQAIAMAIDREEIVNDYLFGTVTPGRGLLPPGIPGYRDNPKWLSPNIEEAKRLLAASGHPNGAGLPELKLSFAMENPDIGRIADQIGAQLREKLGVNIRLDKMETGTLISKQNRRQLMAVVSGWFADYIDPQDFISMLLVSGSAENHWNYRNYQFDTLCKEADSCPEPKLRLELYAKAEDMALQDAVMIPIAYWKTPILTRPRVHGVKSYLGQFLPYNTVTLDP